MKFRPGDKVLYHCRPGIDPGVTREYRVEGTVVLAFEPGDKIDPCVQEVFGCHPGHKENVKVGIVVIRKTAGGYTWMPRPQCRHMTKIED